MLLNHESQTLFIGKFHTSEKLKMQVKTLIKKSFNNSNKEITYSAPANPAALFLVTVGSGGLHMMITSWSDIMTTPGI
jgi:hypothetical protein